MLTVSSFAAWHGDMVSSLKARIYMANNFGAQQHHTIYTLAVCHRTVIVWTRRAFYESEKGIHSSHLWCCLHRRTTTTAHVTQTHTIWCVNASIRRPKTEDEANKQHQYTVLYLIGIQLIIFMCFSPWWPHPHSRWNGVQILYSMHMGATGN